jgi:hypothetical protein
VIRFAPAAPVAALGFLAVLALSASAMSAGFLFDDAVTLWAGAIAAGDGEISIGRIVAAYPTIPFLATTLAEFVTPATAPTPALLAALLLGLMAGGLLLALREAGVGIVAAVAATILVALHPALLRAALAGPADMFLAAFLALFAKGLYDLRARSSAPDVMTVALAMLGLSFSHPIGAAITVASAPFLALAVRPAIAANSGLNVVVALIFPTAFSIGAFVYVSWVFPGSGWSFFTAPSASIAAWIVDLPRGPSLRPTGLLVLDAGLMTFLALVASAPAAVAALVLIRRRRPLVMPALVLTAGTIVAVMMSVATGVFGSPVAVTIVAPVLAATVLIRIPGARERMPIMLVLLMIGWIGGAFSVLMLDPRLAAQFREATADASDRERVDALNLGHATRGREGILVDTVNAPAVVLGRGHAHGLLAPHGEGFGLTILFARIDAPFVALPDPQSAAGALDQLNKTFPRLFRNGSPGYRLVYQNSTWRLFERNTVRTVSND